MVDVNELTPFEWSMIHGAQKGLMTFYLYLDFQGQLKPTALQAAIKTAASRHPFLQANVAAAPPPQQTSRWAPATDPQPFISIAESDVPFDYPGSESIDLTSELGVRVWVRHGSDPNDTNDSRVKMRFQFHHACCDGLGAFQMIEDVLCCYHQNVVGKDASTELRPIDNQALAYRTAVPDKRLPIYKRIARSTVILPIRISKLFAQTADFISSSEVTSDSVKTDSLPNLPTHVFSRGFTQSLVSKALDGGATLNDLLVRDLFLTIRDWNQSQNAKPSRNIRLMIPFSLRTDKHVQMPAANCVSMVYMAAPTKLLQNPQQLLTSVTRQRHFIRAWQIEHSWNQTAGLIASSPWIAKLARRRAQRRITTSVLTNLGRVFAKSGLPEVQGKVKCGELLLESTVLVPPATATATLTFGCNTYADELGISLNFDRQHFPQADAQRLLEFYVDRLRATQSVQ